MKLMRILILTMGCLFVMGSLAEAPVQAQVQVGAQGQNSKRTRVHQLIVTRLANGLSLDQAGATQLGNVLQQNRQRKKRYRNEIRQLTAQLRGETSSGNEKALQATLKKLGHARDQLDRSDETMFSEVKTMLTPNQLAQFVLIMDEIRHEVKSVRRRGRRQFQQGGVRQPTWGQPPAGGQRPAGGQPGYTNQPGAGGSGYFRGYGPPAQNGVWVGN